ncbi:MAG TPA: mandelate racemase/muconate lactonizing enzyme family protein [Gammaproteobacteria bacterium]|nr:mandelate racemase/muconate lactonizing enzyme family protein [Gammaproteobacteria bacterium]
MKISGLKTFLIPTTVSDSEWALGKAFLLIKVETDSGLSGWGEAYVPHDCEHAIDALIRAMARYLEGADPLKIEKFRHNALNAFANLQTGFHLSCAIAGIEMALWDITGIAMEQPVYRLLGSPCRTQVPVYANCHSNKGKSIDDIVEYAKARYAEGFRSVKIYPFLDQTAVEQGLTDLQHLRESLESDCTILVDAWRALDYDTAILACAGLEQLGVKWLEDPVPLDDLQALSRITSETSLSIVTGETLSTETEFELLLQKNAANILNPDIACCGLSQIRSIAATGHARSCQMAIHNFNTMGLGLAASLHIAAIIPNLAGVEYFPRFQAASDQFCLLHWQHGEDHAFKLCDKPGLGVTVDESALARFEHQPGPARPWPD